MRTEKRNSYETDDDIRIHDLNDPGAELQWRGSVGQTGRGAESGKQRDRARRAKESKEKEQKRKRSRCADTG